MRTRISRSSPHAWHQAALAVALSSNDVTGMNVLNSGAELIGQSNSTVSCMPCVTEGAMMGAPSRKVRLHSVLVGQVKPASL